MSSRGCADWAGAALRLHAGDGRERQPGHPRLLPAAAEVGHPLPQPGDRRHPVPVQPGQALPLLHRARGGLLQQEEHLHRPLQLGRHGEGVQHAVLQTGAFRGKTFDQAHHIMFILGLHGGDAGSLQFPGQEAALRGCQGL